jgi:cytochrome oxidase Cu insertion factor (SCO1/SenC/PrrC family)
MAGEKNSQKFRAMRDPWMALGAMGSIAALIIAVFAIQIVWSKKKTQTYQTAPGFVLRDQMGQLTSLAQFRGKVVALTFIDPECHQLCPLTTQSMVEALKILGPAAESRVQLLGIDANPQKTQIADVADYTRTHELEGRWRFLTGAVPELKRIWKSYGVYVAVVNNDIEHTAVIFLIDKNGNERGVYTTPMSYESVGDQAQTLAAGIAQLLPGHPAISAPSEASEEQNRSPNLTRSMDLTALGPKRQAVVFGAVHPHLVLFFAGWLGQDSRLSTNLAVLDGYAELARRHGWPSPVAVNELTTEPSAAEAQHALTPLAAGLRTPIVEDTTGRIADDYHVQDLPWFVLNSASGKILWQHDGWLSAAALDKQVSAALPQS